MKRDTTALTARGQSLGTEGEGATHVPPRMVTDRRAQARERSRGAGGKIPGKACRHASQKNPWLAFMTSSSFRLGALILGVILLIAGLMVWWQNTTQDDAVRASQVQLEPDNSALLSVGRQIYFSQCAACHGEQLQGEPNWRDRGADGRLPAPPHDPSGHTWHHPDAQLFALTKYGIGPTVGQPDYPSNMPAYDGVLTDHEIIAVLSWIKAQWPEEIQQKHDDINRQAAQR